ncbi:MAG: ribbon-helix-helix protein, CopG family [Gammaproteobacteria bacterium]|nr:ribbon-helix-helix protein, CopG family [Gammaproteobacteria bacterium]
MEKQKKKYSYPSPTPIRLGGLADRVTSRARDENTDISKLIRRAIQHYLDAVPAIDRADELANGIANCRQDLARVGSNLNQLALAFNVDDTLNGDELAQAHTELRHEFKTLMHAIKSIESALKSRP